MQMSRDSSLKADGILVLVTMLAGGGWFFSLFALRGLPTFFFIGTRFLLAGAVLGVFGFHALLRLRRRDLCRAALTGVASCLSITLWTKGLLLSDNLGVGAFICSLGNIVAPLFGWLLFRIRIKPVTWLAVGIATAGMACLSLRQGSGLAPAHGYFLASAIANSLYLNLNHRYASRIPPLPMTAVQLTVVGALALAYAAILQEWPATIHGETAGWLLASVLIATSLRFFLLVKGQEMVPLSHTAVIMNLEPVWTALLAGLCLGTTITGVQLAGCLLIFLALLSHHIQWRRPVNLPQDGQARA